MKGKRLFSLFLVTTLIFSSSSVVSADTGNSATITNISVNTKQYSSQKIPVDSSMVVPTIKLTLPTSTGFVINPYNLQVDSELGLSVSDEKATIISPEYTITSDSNVDLSINATLTKAVVSGTVTVASTPVSQTTLAKSAFIYLDFKGKGDEGYSRVVKKVNGVSTTTYAESGSVYNRTSTSQVRLSSSSDMTKKDVAVIARNGGTVTYKFFGSTSPNPKKAWTSEDNVTTTIKFTFVPLRITD